MDHGTGIVRVAEPAAAATGAMNRAQGLRIFVACVLLCAGALPRLPRGEHVDDGARRAPDAGGPVRVGQRVTAGTLIGYIGMTGWTTGPHVHFMTIVNGRAVDPMPYLPRR